MHLATETVRLGRLIKRRTDAQRIFGEADKKANLCSRGLYAFTSPFCVPSWDCHEGVRFLCLGPRHHVGGKPHPFTTTTTTTARNLHGLGQTSLNMLWLLWGIRDQ